MSKLKVSVTAVPGVCRSQNRALAWVTVEGDKDVNAGEEIARIAAEMGKERRDVWSRFDHWLAGNNDAPKLFHTWSDPDCRGLFVFKWRVGAERRRLYGFFMHPKANNRAFLTCVLFHYGTKAEWSTDPLAKKKFQQLRAMQDVQMAITKAFA